MDRGRRMAASPYFAAAALVSSVLLMSLGITECAKKISVENFVNSAEEMAVEAGILAMPPNCSRKCEVKPMTDATRKCAAVPHAILLPDRCHCYNTFFTAQNITGPGLPTFINVTNLCNEFKLFKVLISNETLVERALVSRGFSWYEFDFSKLTGEEQARLGYIPLKTVNATFGRVKRQMGEPWLEMDDDAASTTTASNVDASNTTTATTSGSTVSEIASTTPAQDVTTAASEATTTTAEVTTTAPETTTTVQDTTTTAVTEATITETATTEASTTMATETTTMGTTDAQSSTATTGMTTGETTEMPVKPTALVTDASMATTATSVDTFSTTLPTSTTLPIVVPVTQAPVQMILYPAADGFGGYSLVSVPVQAVAGGVNPGIGVGTVRGSQAPLTAIAYPGGMFTSGSGLGANSMAGSVSPSMIPGSGLAVPPGLAHGLLGPGPFKAANGIWANLLGVPARAGSVPARAGRTDRGDSAEDESDDQDVDDDDTIGVAGNGTSTTSPPINAISKENSALIAGTSPQDCHDKCHTTGNQAICQMICASKGDNKNNFGSFVTWSKAF